MCWIYVSKLIWNVLQIVTCPYLSLSFLTSYIMRVFFILFFLLWLHTHKKIHFLLERRHYDLFHAFKSNLQIVITHKKFKNGMNMGLSINNVGYGKAWKGERGQNWSKFGCKKLPISFMDGLYTLCNVQAINII